MLQICRPLSAPTKFNFGRRRSSRANGWLFLILPPFPLPCVAAHNILSSREEFFLARVSLTVVLGVLQAGKFPFWTQGAPPAHRTVSGKNRKGCSCGKRQMGQREAVKECQIVFCLFDIFWSVAHFFPFCVRGYRDHLFVVVAAAATAFYCVFVSPPPFQKRQGLLLNGRTWYYTTTIVICYLELCTRLLGNAHLH